MLEAKTMSYADALRGYLSHLRVEKKVSQRTLAEVMGIARNTYISWETGDTKDLKVPSFIKALRFFEAPLEHLEQLADVETEEEGRRIADEWLRMPPDQQAQVARMQAKLGRIIELGEKDPERLEQIVSRLRADAESDPLILDLVMAWLDGRRSR